MNRYFRCRDPDIRERVGPASNVIPFPQHQQQLTPEARNALLWFALAV